MMIYMKGSETLKEILKNYDTTSNLTNAACAVVEMPGNLKTVTSITGIPVVIVVAGMVTLQEWKAIKNLKMTQLKSIPAILDEVLENLPKQEDIPDEIDLCFADNEPKYCPGVSEEETMPASRQQLSPALRRNKIEMFNKSYAQRGYIAASFSAAGGVGKTFTSINIGGEAAIKGVDTVVVDLDLGYGDIDTATGLVDPAHRNKVIGKKALAPKEGWATVKEWRKYARDLKGSLLRHNSGLYILPSYPYAGDEISEVETEELILSLSEVFDFVMIDLGVNAFAPHARTALNMANTIFMIGGQDEKTIAKFTHFELKESQHREKMRLVINMVKPTGYYTPKEIAKKFEFKEYNEIPNDEQGVNAAKKARKLSVQLKGSPAGEAVKAIVARHLPFEIEYEPQDSSQKTWLANIKNFKGIFARR